MSSSCRKRAPVSALTWASGQSNSPSSTSSGQLWFASPTSAITAEQNLPFSYALTASGGVPPYT